MHLRTQYWIPIIIFLISFCLHLSLISKGPVTVDCLNLVVKSQATTATHHLQFLFGSGYPLMVLLGSIFISLGKWVGITDPVLAVNCISVIFSSIAILVFYLLIQKICDTLTAILASFILLFNPIFLDVSTYGINHAPALCFFILGLLSLMRFQNSKNIQSLLFSSLYFGFMGATRLQDFILTFPAISYMFILGLKEHPSPNKNHKIQDFLIFTTTISLIIILFHLPYFILDHTNYKIQAENFWKIGLIDNFHCLFSMPLRSSLLYLVKAFSFVGIVCFGAGLYYTAKFNKKLLFFTILCWIIPLSFYGNAVTSAPRFFTIILPALIIPISIFLAHLLKQAKIQWKIVSLMVFLIIIFQPLLYTEGTFIRRHNHALISDYYRWVGKSTEPNAIIICSDDKPFITYYSQRETLQKPERIGLLSPNELFDFKKKLDNILKNQRPIYITTLALSEYDFHQDFKNFMQQNYLLVEKGQIPLELWYQTPYEPYLMMVILKKIEKK